MKFLLLLPFLLIHPLEDRPMPEMDFSTLNSLICVDKYYVSPFNGIVEEIISNNNNFNVKISNETMEIILVNLEKVYKNVGDKVLMGEEVGEDNTIMPFSLFTAIQYNTMNIFPQFYNNKLHFNTDESGIPIFSMKPGFVSIVTYDPYNGRGNYIEVIDPDNSETITKIQYWHLLKFNVQMQETIGVNKRIGSIGNTGLSSMPHLTVFFPNLINDLKAVYIKCK